MMQVQAYSRTGNPSRQAAAVRRSTGGFSVLLADTARKASSGVGVAQLSPAMQMESRYLEWRKTRTPIDLPGSEGWTEENIQYLKDRYPGELSLFERKEALTVMRNMRCITQEEYLRALGEDGQMVVEDAGKATCRWMSCPPCRIRIGCCGCWLRRSGRRARWICCLNCFPRCKPA